MVKTVRKCLIKGSIHLHMTAISLPSEMKTHVHIKTGTQLFMAVLPIRAKTRNNSIVYQQTNG